jgi:hypothetical protein
MCVERKSQHPKHLGIDLFLFTIFFLGGGSVTPLCLSSSSALHFSYHCFLVRHPVNRNDRHFLELPLTSQSHGRTPWFLLCSKAQPKNALVNPHPKSGNYCFVLDCIVSNRGVFKVYKGFVHCNLQFGQL